MKNGVGDDDIIKNNVSDLFFFCESVKAPSP